MKIIRAYLPLLQKHWRRENMNTVCCGQLCDWIIVWLIDWSYRTIHLRAAVTHGCLTAGGRERVQPCRSAVLRVPCPRHVTVKTYWAAPYPAQLQAMPGVCHEHLPWGIQRRTGRCSSLAVHRHISKALGSTHTFLTKNYSVITILIPKTHHNKRTKQQ